MTWFGRMYLQMKIDNIKNKFPDVKIIKLNGDSVVFSMDEKFNLPEEFVISDRNGVWKHQSRNVKEISHFYLYLKQCDLSFDLY